MLLSLFWIIRFDAPHPKMGVTFTPSYARYLGLDPQTTFERLLVDLHPQIIRLPVEWNSLEPARGDFRFDELNWYVNAARDRNIDLILVLGRRTPRWPECHAPEWVEKMSPAEQQLALKNMLTVAVAQFKSAPNIRAWQIENEPFLDRFGLCPPTNAANLQTEINTVRNFDQRPILLTDSGELSTWGQVAPLGDWFGSTLYRVVYSPRLQGAFSYWFLPPAFYRAKAWWQGVDINNFLISELQAEPWFDQTTGTLVGNDANSLVENISYARATGARTILFWGVEYWYAAAARGDGSWLTVAERIFALL